MYLHTHQPGYQDQLAHIADIIYSRCATTFSASTINNGVIERALDM